jgi:hypothetical protein
MEKLDLLFVFRVISSPFDRDVVEFSWETGIWLSQPFARRRVAPQRFRDGSLISTS